jgi:hypothetical protein
MSGELLRDFYAWFVCNSAKRIPSPLKNSAREVNKMRLMQNFFHERKVHKQIVGVFNCVRGEGVKTSSARKALEVIAAVPS